MNLQCRLRTIPSVIGLSIALTIGIVLPVAAQEDSPDYNQYYRFPLSVGVGFQSLTPLSDFPLDLNYNVLDVSAQLAAPIPNLPYLHPQARLGYIRYQSQSGSTQWDHDEYYSTLGMMYVNRFSKFFEVGLGGSAGISQSVFQNLVAGDTAYGGVNMLLDAGLKVGLSPSYSFNLELSGQYRHVVSLNNNIAEFNGGQIGVGVTLNYRLGKDPDSSSGLIRSLKFQQMQLEPLFASMQSYYASNSIGTMTITNVEKRAVSDLEVYMYQPGFMDTPTQSATIDELQPGESVDVNLYAVFNNQVFTTEGTTPLTAQIITHYTYGGRPVEQVQPASYDLYDKNAMVWDDDRKVAAFITPSDSALHNYTSFINQATKDDFIDAFNIPLQKAIQSFRALDVIGITYQIDPITPFSSVQENQRSVDSVSLPRNTLKNAVGDCDDLTALFNSLLEAMGVETGFITTPGHIYSVFNTGLSGRDYDKIHPDEDMFIRLEGNLWIPVEITLIGRTGFLEAWQEGAGEWFAYDNEPTHRGFYRTRTSHQVYRPVALREADLGLQYGDASDINSGFTRELRRLVDLNLEGFSRTAERTGDKSDYNRLGIAAAKLERYDMAERAFTRAVSIDRDYMSAKVNLGNILFLRDQYARALDVYKEAIDKLETVGRNQSKSAMNIYLNISKCHYQLEQFGDARESFQVASAINQDQTSQYAYLAAADSLGAARASESDWNDILFLEEE